MFTTTVAADGYTAVRVNIPPIGFNQARVQIQIEGMSSPIDALIDLEVPGIIIIDPGHGGGDPGANGRTDNTVREKDLALSYASELKPQVIKMFELEKLNFKVFMTRSNDIQIPNSDRAALARDEGADVFVSIHFNSATNTSARGTEYVTRSSGQVNAAEDALLGEGIQGVTLAAVLESDPGGKHRGFKSGGFAVVSDSTYGNTAAFSPIRGTIIEVEFLSHATALGTVKLTNATGLAIKKKFSKDAAREIFSNIYHHQ